MLLFVFFANYSKNKSAEDTLLSYRRYEENGQENVKMFVLSTLFISPTRLHAVELVISR